MKYMKMNKRRVWNKKIGENEKKTDICLYRFCFKISEIQVEVEHIPVYCFKLSLHLTDMMKEKLKAFL